MGDFNAGCGYFAKKYWGENALRTDDRFVWLIDDDVDTTVGKADCAYDRYGVLTLICKILSWPAILCGRCFHYWHGRYLHEPLTRNR